MVLWIPVDRKLHLPPTKRVNTLLTGSDGYVCREMLLRWNSSIANDLDPNPNLDNNLFLSTPHKFDEHIVFAAS
jgi:hypothetical protein